MALCKCLLAGGGRPSASGEQPEPVIQMGEDVRRGTRTHACGGQLERQRDPVEAPAQPGEGWGIAVAHAEPITGIGGPLDEEAHGVR